MDMYIWIEFTYTSVILGKPNMVVCSCPAWCSSDSEHALFNKQKPDIQQNHELGDLYKVRIWPLARRPSYDKYDCARIYENTGPMKHQLLPDNNVSEYLNNRFYCSDKDV